MFSHSFPISLIKEKCKNKGNLQAQASFIQFLQKGALPSEMHLHHKPTRRDKWKQVPCVGADSDFNGAQCLVIYRNVLWRIKTPNALFIWGALNWKGNKLRRLTIPNYLIFDCIAINIHCSIFMKKCSSSPETIRVSNKDFAIPWCAKGYNMRSETLI